MKVDVNSMFNEPPKITVLHTGNLWPQLLAADVTSYLLKIIRVRLYLKICNSQTLATLKLEFWSYKEKGLLNSYKKTQQISTFRKVSRIFQTVTLLEMCLNWLVASNVSYFGLKVEILKIYSKELRKCY